MICSSLVHRLILHISIVFSKPVKQDFYQIEIRLLQNPWKQLCLNIYINIWQLKAVNANDFILKFHHSITSLLAPLNDKIATFQLRISNSQKGKQFQLVHSQRPATCSVNHLHSAALQWGVSHTLCFECLQCTSQRLWHQVRQCTPSPEAIHFHVVIKQKQYCDDSVILSWNNYNKFLVLMVNIVN